MPYCLSHAGGETVFPNSVEKPSEEQAAQLSGGWQRLSCRLVLTSMPADTCMLLLCQCQAIANAPQGSSPLSISVLLTELRTNSILTCCNVRLHTQWLAC
eukprot:GHRQ01011588.1.p3 GENE.GHRQ01011588.1~~GHRQ01011588.1.p3  ORF type:complete len:100 (+),score=10.09 GHRQ01011588.1:1906-2205(+)